MFTYSSNYLLRKFNLVYILAQAGDYLDINELTEELKTNQRIIDNDVQELLKTDLNKILTIEENNKKYRLKFKPNYTIDAIGHYMLSNSTRFTVLEYVFFNNNQNLDELAETLHFSTATLYRIIQRINKGIKKQYNLKFVTNPCRLAGNEEEIRSFYIQYFAERYQYHEWPFDDIDRERLLDLFKLFTSRLGFKLQYSDLRFLELSLAVSHIRSSQGLYIKGAGPRLAGILSYLNNNKVFMDMFLSIFKDNANKKVFNDNLIYMIKEHFFFNYGEFTRSAASDDYSKKSLNFLNGFVDTLSEKHGVPVTNKNQLVYNIHNSGQLGVRNLNVRPLLLSNKYQLLSEFKNLFENFYNDVETGLIEYTELMELEHREFLLNHLMHNFLTRWEGLYKTLYENQRKIKVRVVSSHDIYHAKFMMGMIQNEFNLQVDASLIGSYELEHLHRDKDDTDILVTNFTFVNDDVYVVAVNDIPTTDDFNTINKLIKKIRVTDN